MTKVQTDTYQLTINIKDHGNAQIQNVVAPTEIYADTSYQIEYDVINNGGTDIMYGQITDDDSDPTEIISGTEWGEEIVSGQTNHYVAEMPGLTAPLNATIEVGYVTED